MFKIAIYILLNILFTDSNTAIHTEHFLQSTREKKEVTLDNIFYLVFS